MRRTFVLGGIGIAAFLAVCIGVVSWSTGAPGPAAPPREQATAAGPDALEPPARAARAPLPAAVTPPPVAGTAPSRPAEPPAPRIVVSGRRVRGEAPPATRFHFKLDPRLTAGLHMGTRWVSPATFVGVQEGAVFTIAVRARGAAGGGARAARTWLPSEPDMVAVTPHEGDEVELTVLRPGRSTLSVTSAGAASDLVVDAVEEAGGLRVSISQ
jgi:hypothetical protein